MRWAKCWCQLCGKGSQNSSQQLRRWGCHWHQRLLCLCNEPAQATLSPTVVQTMAFFDSKNTPPKCIKTSSVFRSHGPTCCRHTVVAVCIGGRKSILGGEPSVCFVLKVHFLEIQVVTVTSIQVALAVAAGSQKSQHSGLRDLA